MPVSEWWAGQCSAPARPVFSVAFVGNGGWQLWPVRVETCVMNCATYCGAFVKGVLFVGITVTARASGTSHPALMSDITGPDSSSECVSFLSSPYHDIAYATSELPALNSCAQNGAAELDER